MLKYQGTGVFLIPHEITAPANPQAVNVICGINKRVYTRHLLFHQNGVKN
jgi:hypothetical protein